VRRAGLALLLIAVAALSWGAAPAMAAGTKVSVHRSDYGRMLWGPDRQAIYIFERDLEDKRSHCYGECAKDWPPVLTKEKPVAGKGVRESLLGTKRRRNDKKQVTYAGKPLYYYAHEGSGEVLCHDVFLNGGYWWVVGRDGERRP
jgi:predicted lipoprotein with Yx(FWY)xxD motif